MSHARDALPAECCGLLLGNESAIAEAVAIPNTSDDPNRFFIEPAAHIIARRLARERGLAVLGFYHSHPHSSPAPSATDLLEASYPDHLYLIVSLASPAPQIRLFRYCAETRRSGGDESGVPRTPCADDAGRRVGGSFVETPFVTSL